MKHWQMAYAYFWPSRLLVSFTLHCKDDVFDLQKTQLISDTYTHWPYQSHGGSASVAWLNRVYNCGKVVTHSRSLQYHLKEDEIYFASCSLHLFFLMLSWGVFPCDHQHCSLRLILNKCFTFLKIILKRGLKKKVY